MLNTRYGAALSASIPFVVVMLIVYVFGAPNTLLNKTLVPDIDIFNSNNDNKLFGKDNNIFGTISIDITTIAFKGSLNGATCDGIAVLPRDPASLLSCRLINYHCRTFVSFGCRF